jgi:hypothetical protein
VITDLCTWFVQDVPIKVFGTANESFKTGTLDSACGTLYYRDGKIINFEARRFSPNGYEQRCEFLVEDMVSVSLQYIIVSH